MSDSLISPEEINALRQDAARFRFLARITPEWTITHKGTPTEHYIVMISWHSTHNKYDSLAELVDAGMKELEDADKT